MLTRKKNLNKGNFPKRFLMNLSCFSLFTDVTWYFKFVFSIIFVALQATVKAFLKTGKLHDLSLLCHLSFNKNHIDTYTHFYSAMLNKILYFRSHTTSVYILVQCDLSTDLDKADIINVLLDLLSL